MYTFKVTWVQKNKKKKLKKLFIKNAGWERHARVGEWDGVAKHSGMRVPTSEYMHMRTHTLTYAYASNSELLKKKKISLYTRAPFRVCTYIQTKL